ncbi:MAG: 1-deoxy-D-xylulose-5-phosphate reductoisomerase, partial [Actinobacteria bacterium]|nr:1-deoxy-D-xylulose-5-phosphate reductoisomerase [Actinomycetota bacterium]
MDVISVSVAGSTGSIGTQTLDVVLADPDRFRVHAIGASGRSLDALVDQARRVRPAV